jgi:topoisomerase-4 subunit A
MPELSKGRGNKIMDLDNGDELLALTVNYGNSVTIAGTGRGGKPGSTVIEGKDLEPFRGQRARKGHVAPIKVKPTTMT